MTLKGSTNEFPLDVLLRLLAETKKTGELALRGQKGEGALGLSEGRVVTAMYGDEKPIPALGFIWELGDVDFEFTPWNDSPPANLEGNLDENLKRADEYAKWRADVRSVIPHDNIRFRLSERAADQGAVTFTSDRWRVVMAVNTRPSVSELASNLHIDRDDALTTLAGLVRDGVIDTIDEPAPPPTSKPTPGPPPAAEMTSAPAYEPAPPPAPEPVAPETPSEDWTAALVRKAEAQAEPEPEAPRAEAPQSAPSIEPATAPPPPAPAPSSDAWSSITASPAPPEPAAPAPIPDWTSAPSAPAAQWTPTPVAPAAQDWNAVPAPAPAPEAPPPMAAPADWMSNPASQEPSPQPWAAAPAPPPDWTSTPVAPPPAPAQPEPSFTPPADTWGAPQPASETSPATNEWAPAQPAQPSASSDWGAPKSAEPQPIDDRLAALQGMFNTPAPAADTWTTPQAPSAPSAPAEDPRLAAMTAPPPAAPETTAQPNEWAPPPTVGAPQQKKGGLFGGLFGRKAAPASDSAVSGNGGGSRAGKLAAFSNALLAEYTSGSYGKGKVDERMPSLLMRVDEQADPIDRPLPVVDDRLDVQALERVQIAENQAVPYLATLVSTIYSDAEKAFGKDKAKRGYKAAQQQIFGADAAALSGPDIAGKLPKI